MSPPRKKILLIDDDPSVTTSLWMALNDEFDTHAASTVREGVRMFDVLHPNAVVLDFNLPDNHGLEALRRIRTMDRAAPVVILTGFATLETVEESMRLGASDCLHKPFDAATLKNRLRQLASPDRGNGVARKTEKDGATTDRQVVPARHDDAVAAAFLHDVSNPLTSMLAMSELLGRKETGKNPQEIGEIARMIHENATYMAALIQQWRAFTEPGTLPSDNTGIAEIVRQSVALAGAHAQAVGATIQTSVRDPDEGPRLNRHAVMRVLVNLLQNAAEAGAGKSVAIALHARRSGSWIEFVVKDNGPGIPLHATGLVFEPHYTTKAHGGGLGLHISRRIIEAAGGSISLDTQPGRGCIFTIRLPSR